MLRGHLLSAANADRLKLSFNACDVTIDGTGLRELLRDLQTFRVEVVRVAKGERKAVTKIEVIELDLDAPPAGAPAPAEIEG